MHRPFEFFLPFLIAPLLLTAPYAYAQAEPPEPVQPVVNIDLQGVIDGIANLGTNLGGMITNIPDRIMEVFNDWLTFSVIEFNDPLLGLAKYLLSANPDIDPMFKWWQAVVVVISAFYLLLFLLIGFMFLYYSINAEKRAVAKEWLKNAFIMIIGVNLSFWLYKVILELATAMTQYIWIVGFENFFDGNMYAGAGPFLLMFYAIGIGLALLTLFIRYVFLLIGVMLFPIGIFLYYIPPLSNWGKMIFNLLGIMLFMQFLDVIVFVAANQVAVDLGGMEGSSMVPAFSFLLVGILNVIIIFYAVLKAAFSASENSSVLAFGFGAISGQIGGLVSALKPVAGKK